MRVANPRSWKRILAPIALAPAILLAAFVAGCHDHGDPVRPPVSLTGRWSVPSGLDVGMTLELLDGGDGSLSGKVLIDDGGSPIGEYAIREGTTLHGDFSFTIDPLEPPLLDFLEKLGTIGRIRFAGHMETHESLALTIEQECGAAECFSSEIALPLPASIFTNSATVERVFGRAGSFASLALEQDGSALAGFITIIFGTSQGGVALPAMPIREGAVTDSSLVFFLVDPADDATGILADSLGCTSPIFYGGFLDAGSTVRFRVLQRDIVDGDTTVCVNGSTTWPAADVFSAYRETTAVALGSPAPSDYDLVMALTQDGSVIGGTVTLENDQVREGPFTIEEGRFAAGRVTFLIRPGEKGSLSFVTSLGSASPITFEIAILGGTTASLAVRQACPCLQEMLTASRIPIGF